MRKYIVPITLIIIFALVYPLFMMPEETPLPKLKTVEALNGRITLALPEDVVESGATLNYTSQNWEGGEVAVYIHEVGQASVDFPDTEIFLLQQENANMLEVHMLRPDLLMYTFPAVPSAARAWLKFPDGSIVGVELQVSGDRAQDPSYCKRLCEAVVSSIQPGTRQLDLSARTELLEMPGSGVSLDIPVPQGFLSFRFSPAEEEAEGVVTRFITLNLGAMTPLDRENTRNIVSLSISNAKPEALPEQRGGISKREGVLLGQKMEWTVAPARDGLVLVEGYVPIGESGWYFSAASICPESGLPAFFSMMDGVTPTPTISPEAE